jgi:membrane-bound lytic murein transglycosylase A
MSASNFPPVFATAARDWRDVSLTRLTFADLAFFEQDDHLEAFSVFARSCAAIVKAAPALRRGRPPSPALEAIACEALRRDIDDSLRARLFFETNFRPFRVSSKGSGAGGGDGFLTGYYEPIVEGSLVPTPNFTAPVLARPDDLDQLTPYPDRAAIEAGAIERHAAPLVWLRDRVEVFLAQVQGSARVHLTDGRTPRLVYGGRNGHPYTSIGRILMETGKITEPDMSLSALKAWIRAHGQNPGDPGFELMQRNKSYVFFALQDGSETCAGPIGGEGISLSALRSIAIDRSIWSYGLPFWIKADLPWRGPSPSPFRRLMIAQDTGSAIVGPARADIFFGSGDDAGARAGDIRHRAEVVVLLPAEEALWTCE